MPPTEAPPPPARPARLIARWHRAWPARLRNEVVLLALACATLGTFLVTPRPTAPTLFPLPHLDAEARRAREAEEKERAARGFREPLPTRARVVGEELRRAGLALSQGAPDSERWLRELARDTQKLIEAGGTDELLVLRALQAELFVAEVERCVQDQRSSLELEELGADFYRVLTESWLDDSGRLLLSSDDLRLLFRVRFGLLTGTHRRAPFGPELEELRRYYALQLELPQGRRALDPHSLAEKRLEVAQALGAVDPTYPVELAAGIFLLQTDRPALAVQAFDRHLAAHPTGPWALRAKNHLLAALRRTAAEHAF